MIFVKMAHSSGNSFRIPYC